jgi:hypothetical protein
VIVRVPQGIKNVAAGNRCKRECHRHGGVTASFD